MAPSKASRPSQRKTLLLERPQRANGVRWEPQRKAKNADRIPPHQWESKRATILKLYQEEQWILEDVMLHMTEKHNFCPTKRQYVHQLGKWGVTKYRTRGVQASNGVGAAPGGVDPGHFGPGPAPGLHLAPLQHAGSTELLAPASIPEESSVLGNFMRDPFSLGQVLDGQEHAPSYAQSASEGDFDDPNDPIIDDWRNNTVNDNGKGKEPATDPIMDSLCTNLPFNIHNLHPDRLESAAYALFAASDDEMAFPLLYKLHTIRPHDTDVLFLLARSATTALHTSIVRLILDSPSSPLRSADFINDTALIPRLFDIYTSGDNAAVNGLGQGHNDDDDIVRHGDGGGGAGGAGGAGAGDDAGAGTARGKGKGKSNQDAAAAASGSHNASSSYGPSSKEDRSLAMLLEHAHSAALRTTAHNWDRSCIRDCLDWCASELVGVDEIPALLARVASDSEAGSPLAPASPLSPASGENASPYEPSVDTWAQQYELFAFLWRRWQQPQGAGDTTGDGGAWHRLAVAQLGVTGAELLAATCWLLVEMAEEVGAESSRASRLPSPDSYLEAQLSHMSLLGTKPDIAGAAMTESEMQRSPFYSGALDDEGARDEEELSSEEDSESMDEGRSGMTRGQERPRISADSFPDLARTGITHLSNLDDEDLWQRFVDQVGDMNTICDLSPAEERFKARALELFRDFVFETLEDGGGGNGGDRRNEEDDCVLDDQDNDGGARLSEADGNEVLDMDWIPAGEGGDVPQPEAMLGNFHFPSIF